MKLTSLFTLLFLLSISAAAATFNVNTTADTPDAAPGNGVCAASNGLCSLRAAISEANALAGYDYISVPAGTYAQTLVAANEDNNAGGDWDIKSALSITGAGAAATIMRPNVPLTGATERVIHITTDNIVYIAGVTMQSGRAAGAGGGGIRSVGSLALQSVRVYNNQAASGGGIYTQGTLVVTDSVIDGNKCVSTSGCSGGGILADLAAGKHLTLTGSQVSANDANWNTAAAGTGAGIAVVAPANASATLNTSTVSDNRGGGTGSRGAGVYFLSNAGQANFNVTGGVLIQNNKFSSSGGIFFGIGLALQAVSAGKITSELDGLRLYGNSPATEPSNTFTYGGNMSVDSSGGDVRIYLSRSSLIRGRAMYGGGLSLRTNSPATAVIGIDAKNVTFGENYALNHLGGETDGEGGAVHFDVNSPTRGIWADFVFCTFNKNSAGNNVGHTFHNVGNPEFESIRLYNSVITKNGAANYTHLAGEAWSRGYNDFPLYPGGAFTRLATDAWDGTFMGALTDSQYYPVTAQFYAIPVGQQFCGDPYTPTDQIGNPRPWGSGCNAGAIETP